MDNQITQQDKLDLIWVLAHAHISVSFPCTYAGFQGCYGRPTGPDLTNEIVRTEVKPAEWVAIGPHFVSFS